MHTTAVALALVVAAGPAAAQDWELAGGGGFGMQVFDEHLLTYPTAEGRVSHWWGNWGVGGGASLQVGTVLHPYAQGAWGFDLPAGTRFIGVSRTTKVALYGRRRWLLQSGAEIDLAAGWANFHHVDRSLLPDGKIGSHGHGVGGFAYSGHVPAWEALFGRRVNEWVGWKVGVSCAIGSCDAVVLVSIW